MNFFIFSLQWVWGLNVNEVNWTSVQSIQDENVVKSLATRKSYNESIVDLKELKNMDDPENHIMRKENIENKFAIL